MNILNSINKTVSKHANISLLIGLFFLFLIINHLVIKPFHLMEGMSKCTPGEEKRMNDVSAKAKVLNDKYKKIQSRLKKIDNDSKDLLFNLQYNM